jgi:hypothetical protein
MAVAMAVVIALSMSTFRRDNISPSSIGYKRGKLTAKPASTFIIGLLLLGQSTMAQNKTPLTSEELNRRNIGAASMARRRPPRTKVGRCRILKK